MATIHLTKGQFKKRIADYEKNKEKIDFLGDKPAIIDFYAAWCGPCRMFSPVFEEVSDEYFGKVDFLPLDILGKCDTMIFRKGRKGEVYAYTERAPGGTV